MGDIGVTGGHALRRADNDTPYNFLLFVCYIPIIGLNQFIRPRCYQKPNYALTVVNGQSVLHEIE